MRVTVTIAPLDHGTWSVSIAWPGRAPTSRTMTRLRHWPWVSPDPSTIDPELATLLKGEFPPIVKLADRVAGIGELGPGEPERVGRFLFAALLGDDWNDVCDTEHACGVLELALVCEHARELHGLPWELMHDDEQFVGLDERHPIAITRIVHRRTSGESALRPIQSPPRVLFAVGSRLSDARVRAGAEFLGLMHALEERGGSLHPLVLDNASPERLGDAVERFAPDVVHIISHGKLAPDGTGLILMRGERGEGDSDYRSAASLLPGLRRAGNYPPLVILSACDGAHARGPEAASLASELVEGGVPMVVAMSGCVTDLACRLFTRRFGEVLVMGEPLIEAVAHARRAAKLGQGWSPTESTDWALPSVFLADEVLAASRERAYRPVTLRAGKTVNDVINDFGLDRRPVFCGRRLFIERYEGLLRKDHPRNVLVVYNDGSPGLGEKRLLHELSAHALRDGHIPCLIRGGADPPRSLGALAVRLLMAIQDVRRCLDLDAPVESGLLKLLTEDRPFVARAQPHEKEARHDELADRLEEIDADPPVVTVGHVRRRAAADLEALATDARASQLPTAGGHTRAVLLLESVDQWHETLETLFAGASHNPLVNQHGLGRPGHPIPVVMTCVYVRERNSGHRWPAEAHVPSARGPATRDSRRPSSRHEPLAPDVLDKYWQDHRHAAWVNWEELGPFSAGEDSLAYEWMLLNPRNDPTIPGTDKLYAVRDGSDAWFTLLQGEIQGIPRLMQSATFYRLAQWCVNYRFLEAGDDEDVLNRYLEQQAS